MTPQEQKIIDAFEKRSQEIGDLTIGCYECGETINREAIKDFLLSTIREVRAERDAELKSKIGFLRQWLNEDRIDDAKKMVDNWQLEHWLFTPTSTHERE